MYAAYVDAGATVGFAATAGNTFSAVEIGYECDEFSLAETRGIFKLYEFAGKFMAQDTWIREVRLSTFIGMQVRSTNANPFHADDGMTLL